MHQSSNKAGRVDRASMLYLRPAVMAWSSGPRLMEDLRSWTCHCMTPPDLPLQEHGGQSTEVALQALGLGLPRDASLTVVAECVVAVQQVHAVISAWDEELAADGALVSAAVAAQTPDTSTAARLSHASQFQLLWNRCLLVSPICHRLHACFAILITAVLMSEPTPGHSRPL